MGRLCKCICHPPDSLAIDGPLSGISHIGTSNRIIQHARQRTRSRDNWIDRPAVDCVGEPLHFGGSNRFGLVVCDDQRERGDTEICGLSNCPPGAKYGAV